jgi:predicted kinase
MRLILMGGLPGAGKSTVAGGLAAELDVTVLSADTVQAALHRAGIAESAAGVASYVVLEALAEKQLEHGRSVLVDAVNPVEAARSMWRALAERRGAALRIIEIVCSDVALHRSRVEARVRNIPGLDELTWARVERRMANYDAWTGERLVLDSAIADPPTLVAQALAYVR